MRGTRLLCWYITPANSCLPAKSPSALTPSQRRLLALCLSFLDCRFRFLACAPDNLLPTTPPTTMLTPHYYHDAGVPHLGRIDLDRVASHVPDSDMRDLETELQHTLASYYDNQGHPIDGLFNLTRQMDTDEDDQFNVDLTILDFLLYKSLDSIFEWRRRANPFGSDLQSALLTMTIGE